MYLKIVNMIVYIMTIKVHTKVYNELGVLVVPALKLQDRVYHV